MDLGLIAALDGCDRESETVPPVVTVPRSRSATPTVCSGS